MMGKSELSAAELTHNALLVHMLWRRFQRLSNLISGKLPDSGFGELKKFCESHASWYAHGGKAKVASAAFYDDTMNHRRIVPMLTSLINICEKTKTS